MATNIESNRDYESIEKPYNNFLERSIPYTSPDEMVNSTSDSNNTQDSNTTPSNGSVEDQPVNNPGSMGDVWIKNFIRSTNWKPKKIGFTIDGQTGYAEFTNVFISGHIQALTGTIGGFTITATTLYGGIIKTAATVGVGSTGVIMDTDGLRGYDSVLGNTFNLPTDGSAPTFASGVINSTIFEIDTSAVMRTSSTVGDGSASSDGILINDTGFYACEANQTLANANVKILVDGTASFSGTITAGAGDIGGWTIGSTALYLDGATDNVSSGMASADYPFYAGKKYANRATAPFRVTEAGAVTATNLTVTGGTITIGDNASIDSGGNATFIGVSTLNMKSYTCFETIGRFVTTGGDVLPIFGNQGCTIAPGTTSTHWSQLLWWITGNVFLNNPTFTCSLLCLGGFEVGDGRGFIGLGNPTINGTTFTETGTHYCGFEFKKVSNVTTVIAIQCDGGGTVTFSSALRTLTNNDYLELFIKKNGTTSIDYYTRLNGGALSSVTTLSATLPSVANQYIKFASTNFASTDNFQIQLQTAAYEH
jgi:hypothetical protein